MNRPKVGEIWVYSENKKQYRIEEYNSNSDTYKIFNVTDNKPGNNYYPAQGFDTRRWIRIKYKLVDHGSYYAVEQV